MAAFPDTRNSLPMVERDGSISLWYRTWAGTLLLARSCEMNNGVA